jgi:hypothetical protein
MMSSKFKVRDPNGFLLVLPKKWAIVWDWRLNEAYCLNIRCLFTITLFAFMFK